MNHAKRALSLLLLIGAPAIVRAAEDAPEAGVPNAGAPASSGPGASTREAGTSSATRAIDPEADHLLRQMTDYLSGLRAFKVQSFSVDEVVTASGRKIEVAGDSLVSVKRPNKLRSERVGTANGLAYSYDGKTMSLYCAADKTYASTPAPPTIDEAIDATRKHYKIEAPGADLLFSRPYDILTEQVKTGQFIGKESVGGVPANHLAFEGDEVDWQIWIQDGAEPLPLRYEITTKTMKEQPEFTVELTHWEPHADIDDASFEFKPPPGAKTVDSFPTECRAQR